MCYATKCYFFSLPTSAVLSYMEYKPMLIFFGLIDAVQRLLKVRMRERERGGREEEIWEREEKEESISIQCFSSIEIGWCQW